MGLGAGEELFPDEKVMVVTLSWGGCCKMHVFRYFRALLKAGHFE
jgi:hypothetical protein